ncbi:hypothetical protein DICPUDRAFT_155061 [Dictyostelium purpureum]|uniref:Transcription factor IIIC-gamma subunit n=1 Tax=Dictyostelium purpureum TaxID=5786 RepID=F0ZSZ6_DICPU|nr:uncharacterized protein DICPUDRAFT_155061 [Dictyostelium purpureum]EGC32939.1 hypothetical protein DICPUDRAFT_155061 [Dictyostelium purpureum]|eukprot:XP_003290547.1 hypothetical protein DICPUDRAFT_155061 [Dictyostelium purpureum]
MDSFLEDEMETDFADLGLTLPNLLDFNADDINNNLEEDEDYDSSEGYDDDDDDSEYETASSDFEESDDEKGESKKSKTQKKSVNIAFPTTPKKPDTPKKQSMLSNKKFVNIKDQFDISNFTDIVKKKKTKSKKKDLESEEEDYQMDTDNEEEEKRNSEEVNADGTTSTQTTTTTTTKPKKKKKKEKEFRIPKQAREILTKANDFYTRGKWNEATSHYAEVIRMVPRLSLPYNILGKIREITGNPKEALSFFIYGAQIEGNNNELWVSTGHRAKALGNLDTALYCFTRAFRCDSSDIDSLWERCELLINKKDYKRAIPGLLKLVSMDPKNPQILEELAKVYSYLGQYHDAVEVIQPMVKEQLLPENPLEYVSLDTVNLLMEFYNKIRNFTDTILTYNKISVKFGSENNVPVDMLSNVIVAYFSIGTEGGTERGTRLLNSRFLPIDPQQVCDLFSDMGESLYQLGRYSEALQTFLRLKDTIYDQASTWVKIAECYRYLKNLPAAIEYLSKANKQVPDNVNTTIAMSEIYKEMGDEEKALQILNQSSSFSDKNEQTEKEIFATTLKELESKREKITPNEVKITFRHAEAFLNLSKYSQFLGIATALLHGSNDKCYLRRKISVGLYRKRRRSIKRGRRADSNSSNSPFAELLDEEDYFSLLVETSKVLSHLNRHQEASQYLRYALRNIKFENSLFTHQLKFIAVGVSFNDKNYYLAFKYVKYVCSKKPYDNKVWNLFNKIIVNYGGRSTVQNRFLAKIYEKYPNSLPVLVMIGNQNKQTDNVRGALFEYIKAYRISPDDPLINLLIGVLILSQVMGRKQANRHKMTIIAYSFIFKYANLRGEGQETDYNIARAFHQLGIYNMAISFYNKVLDSNGKDDEEDKDQSLKCEAAFNLSLIYKTRGNVNLANQILKKYIVV